MCEDRARPAGAGSRAVTSTRRRGCVDCMSRIFNGRKKNRGVHRRLRGGALFLLRCLGLGLGLGLRLNRGLHRRLRGGALLLLRCLLDFGLRSARALGFVGGSPHRPRRKTARTRRLFWWISRHIFLTRPIRMLSLMDIRHILVDMEPG